MTTTETKHISKAQEKRNETARAIEHLREMLPPGSTVYTSLRHVSRSGMFRRIRCLVGHAGSIEDITYWVARACGMKLNDQGLAVGGCGMDMGFHVVNTLSGTLYPKGFECIGERCPSNDHSNGDRDHTPHHHNSGEYALRHQWT